MTLLPEVVAEHEDSAATEPLMAIVDEYGQETPITEFDIRRSLKQLSKDAHTDHHHLSMDQLMERVFAARAIA
ncbi:MAG: hypothetical protein KAU21_21645 [Gammaproteobacteria bacterium]|nr:hypothetical protein [Gammaproteobacteria bacterium]